MKIILYTLLGLILFTLTGCNTALPIESLGIERNDTTIELHSEEQFEIVLEGNPTTGYSWEIEYIDSELLQVVGDPEYISSSNLVGASGEFSFIFRAISPGETRLRLIYHRPWETEIEPIDTFEISVRIN